MVREICSAVMGRAAIQAEFGRKVFYDLGNQNPSNCQLPPPAPPPLIPSQRSESRDLSGCFPLRESASSLLLSSLAEPRDLAAAVAFQQGILKFKPLSSRAERSEAASSDLAVGLSLADSRRIERADGTV
jgi:hypothetical protein